MRWYDTTKVVRYEAQKYNEWTQRLEGLDHSRSICVASSRSTGVTVWLSTTEQSKQEISTFSVALLCLHGVCIAYFHGSYTPPHAIVFMSQPQRLQRRLVASAPEDVNAEHPGRIYTPLRFILSSSAALCGTPPPGTLILELPGNRAVRSTCGRHISVGL